MDQVFEFTPHVLAYTEPNALGCVTFGAMGEPDPNAQFGNPMPVLSLFTDNPYIGDGIKADVPLDGVVRIDVFSSAYSEPCRGIVLWYENGAQRAAGLCRLGIDFVTTYRNPVNFCYSIYSSLDNQSYNGEMVECTTEGDTHDHDHDEYWHCLQMKGSIQYIWNDFAARVEVNRRT